MPSPKDESFDKLIAIGERSTVAPFSLLFSEELSSLEVRVWLCMSGMYHENEMLTIEMLAKKSRVTKAAILEALFVLAVHRWFVWDINQGNPVSLPQVSTSQLSIAEVEQHGSGTYMDDLKYLAKQGSGRAKIEAQAVLAELGHSLSLVN